MCFKLIQHFIQKQRIKKRLQFSKSVYIALGSSIGNGSDIFISTKKYLEKEDIKIIKQSKNHTFPPFGGVAQNDFTNAVWEIQFNANVISRETKWSQEVSQAHQLLKILQACEKEHGRNREQEGRWNDRPLDIDILWFKGEKINTSDLIIPHPEMWKRDFVMRPLSEIL